MAVAQQKRVGRRGAEPGTGGLPPGGAAAGVQGFGRAVRHGGEALGQSAQMALQNGAEQRIEIDVMKPERGGREAHGEREQPEGDGVRAVAGEQDGGRIEDFFLPGELETGEIARAAGEIIGFGAEDAGGDEHVGHTNGLVRTRQVRCGTAGCCWGGMIRGMSG